LDARPARKRGRQGGEAVMAYDRWGSLGRYHDRYDDEPRYGRRDYYEEPGDRTFGAPRPYPSSDSDDDGYGQYASPYDQEYYEGTNVYEPHDRFERRKYQSSDYDEYEWAEVEPRKKIISADMLPNLPFQDTKYNIKIPLMQLTATGALLIIFLLNYAFNPEYVISLSNFSPYVAAHPPVIAAIFGAMFGFFLYIFPSMGRDFKRTIVIGTILILIFFFAAAPLVALFATGSAEEVGYAFGLTLQEFVKIFAVLLYWSPVMLGVYGIWSRKSMFVGLAAMFLFFIIILYDGILLYNGWEMTKTYDDWPVFVLFALALFCFIEMADSAINFSDISDTAPYSQENAEYDEHMNRILQVYYVYFLVFAVIIFIITGVIFSFEGVLKAIGSEQIAESLEIQSIYGITIALVIITFIIILFGIFLRHESTVRKSFEKWIYGEDTEDLYSYESEKKYSTSKLQPYWPSHGTMSKPVGESEVEDDGYF
jgi:hypothetical protein